MNKYITIFLGLLFVASIFQMWLTKKKKARHTFARYIRTFRCQDGCETALSDFDNGYSLVLRQGINLDMFGLRDMREFHQYALSSLRTAISIAYENHDDIKSVYERKMREPNMNVEELTKWHKSLLSSNEKLKQLNADLQTLNTRMKNFSNVSYGAHNPPPLAS